MISTSFRAAVRNRASGRCEYCRSAEVYCGYEFEVDHITPLAAGGLTEIDNLALACSNCNAHKGARTQAIDPETGGMVVLFHPRRDQWREHFEWSKDGGRIIGRTPAGRATVDALQVNNGAVVFARSFWVSYGLHPPKESE